MRIFIGYDSREIPAYHTCVQSIIENSTRPLSITPVALNHLGNIYIREDLRGTTEFSISRFLVPYLSDYKGFSLFMDSDMIVKTDLSKLMYTLELNEYEPSSHFDSVYVCQHDYIPREGDKATGKQVNYPRKNWSSVMLFNNTECRELTPKYVNESSPLDLHRLNWAKSIGRIPIEYNWLVGEYPENEEAKILHYTLGIPLFKGYENSEHKDDFAKYNNLITKLL